MSTLRPLSDSVASLTKGTFARKFISLGRILSSWNDIVGPDIAARAQPAKLQYRKPKTGQEKPEASLHIAVSSADAALLHYQKDLILERINQIFGDRWITAIRFVHVAANETGGFEEQAGPLSKTDEESLARTLAGVEDHEIRKRLEKLGQGVLRKRNKIS